MRSESLLPDCSTRQHTAMQPHAPIGTRLEAIAIVGTMHRHAAIGLVDRNDLGLEADQISDLARERSFPPNQTLPD
jgi:hypothetical protein